MIRRIVRQMLTAQILSALTVSLCLLIDNIMIGRFLGEEALAAYGISNPLLLAIGAIGTLLGVGIQTACGRSIGRGSQEETNEGYSTAVVIALGISVLFTVFVLIFRSPLAKVLGAGNSGTLYDETKGYLAGFSIGAPGSMGAIVLIPFMQMAGKSGLLIVAVLSMSVADIVLDLLNVYVFHAGMFGMGLASSISYYLALIIGCIYFLSKKCVFRFSWKQVTLQKTSELFKGGFPSAFGMVSTMLLVFSMNQILKAHGGSAAVAAFMVVSTIGNASNCITTGIGGVSLTLSGILYNEEDRTELKDLIHLLVNYSVMLGACVGVLLLLFAPALVSLFLPVEGGTRSMAILGLRVFAAGLIPCCINNALKSAYQATERIRLMEILSVAEGLIFPLLACFIGTRIWGLNGAWFYFVVGELITLLSVTLYIYRETGRKPWQDDACLILRTDFGVIAGNLLEADITNMQEVTEIAEKAEKFCLQNGQSARLSNHISLCIEEMASNTVQHGFNKDNKQHHLSVRVLRKKGEWILRFRDDCRAFDPIHYIPNDDHDALGLKLVTALAQEANYTYSLNLNNLMLKLAADR